MASIKQWFRFTHPSVRLLMMLGLKPCKPHFGFAGSLLVRLFQYRRLEGNYEIGGGRRDFLLPVCFLHASGFCQCLPSLTLPQQKWGIALEGVVPRCFVLFCFVSKHLQKQPNQILISSVKCFHQLLVALPQRFPSHGQMGAFL